MKVQELAEKAGMDRDKVSRIERGQAAARLEYLEAIAPALGVTVSDLVAETFTVEM
jgi:transcriptional regulator with XRE-family HTH domain